MAGPIRWSLRHPVSLLGASLVSIAGASIFVLFISELAGFEPNPYLGLLVFLLLPALFVGGLFLIPLGAWLDVRRAAGPYPVLDPNLPAHRMRIVVFFGLTALNVVILSAVTYRGVEFVDSPVFCGRTCHQVMQPEYTAWQSAPHASVACVSCHVGPGASGFFRAKMNGVRQLASVMTGNYPRPLPSPVLNLRPAQETCERCHWSKAMHGDRLKVKTKFRDDEANTPELTVLVMKIGGAHPGGTTGSGIHWHMNLDNKVVFVPTDPSRRSIRWIRLTTADGRETEYTARGSSRPSEEEIRRLGRRMDCVDCHNRPAHVFRPASEAVDEAILAGQIPRDLPHVKKAVVDAITGEYPTRESAGTEIKKSVESFYREGRPEIVRAADVGRAADAAASIYLRNVFPDMKVSWGAYPSLIGHQDGAGCFRCHDGEHLSPSGEPITNDCDRCHTLIAIEETDPEILKQLSP